MPRSGTDRRSLSLDAGLIEFIEKYIKNHELERLQEGKPVTIVSILREGVFAWAEKAGVLEELLAYLKERK